MTFEIRINRWIDPASHGWWSGDHHIHGSGCLHYVNPTEGVAPVTWYDSAWEKTLTWAAA